MIARNEQSSQATLTHTRMACFRTCPRKHYLRYELGIRPEETGYALRVGSGFHGALEAADKGEDIEAAIGDKVSSPYDLALVAAMYDGHCRRWGSEQLEPIAAELPFDLPLINPETGRPTPIWRLAGVIDRIVRLPDGRIALMEYKTTSRDFAPGADYWLRLHMDLQLSIYVIAARMLGYEIDTILYDVTRRPGQRPKKATPESERKYTKKESKLKDGTVRPAGSLHANQREEDETPEEFASRVAADIRDRPEHYFARIEIARLEQDLEECAAELWVQQLTIRACQRNGGWYRDPGACFAPYACEYLPVCQNADLEHQTPMGFVRVDDLHPELAEHATSGG